MSNQINLSDEMINVLMDAVQIAKDHTSMNSPEWDKFNEAYEMLGELLNSTNEIYRRRVFNQPTQII